MNDMVSLSSSVYNSILRVNAGAGHALLAMGELASDNLLRGSNLSDAGGLDPTKLYNQFQNFMGISPTTAQFIEPVWNGLYPAVEQANINIRAFDRLFPDEDPVKKAALTAENRCVRAWLYMFLVNTFGEVVVIPEEELTPKEYSELTNDRSICEIYEYIVEDLRYAVENIPDKDEWTTLYGVPWQGRAHLGTAQGLLAKALLYQAANAKYFKIANADELAAANYAEIVEIVKSMYGQYSLYGDYEALFREEGNWSSESLFEIGTSSTAAGTTSFRGFRPVQPRGYAGYGFNGPSANLMRQYETDGEGNIIDKRYAGTVIFGATSPWSGMEHPAADSPMRNIYDTQIDGQLNANNPLGNGWPNRWCRKLTHRKATSTSNGVAMENLGGNNLKLLRWGEVLLIGAEAAYYADDLVSARQWLKDVRTRAGLDASLGDSMSGEELLRQIWKDKRLEIATEWSNRYFELVRIDKLNPGYMMECMNAKVNDEFDAIISHLDATDGWAAVNKPALPITRDNCRDLLPLKNGLQVPKNYTMPIPSAVFLKMPKLRQTEYWR